MVVDVDGTLAIGHESGKDYGFEKPSSSMVSKLQELRAEGYWIILFTSRNVRKYDGNLGQIIKNTAPVLINWLEKHCIPYDELHFGKPWCGHDGFYIDDRAIRPREFISLKINELHELIERDKST